MKNFTIRGKRRNSGKFVGSARRANPALRAAIDLLEMRRLLSGNVFTVNSAADDPSGPTPNVVTLRDAINAVNNDATDSNSSPDVINFSITGTPTISLLAALPAITNPVSIDGSTQAGVKVNGNSLGTLVDDSNATVNDLIFTGTVTVGSDAVLTVGTGTVSVTGDLDAGDSATLYNYGTLSVTGNLVDAGSLGVYNGQFSSPPTRSAASFTVGGSFTAGGDDSFIYNNGVANFSVAKDFTLGDGGYVYNGILDSDAATFSAGSLTIGDGGYVYNYGDSSLNVTGGFAIGDDGYLYNGNYSTDAATLTVGGSFSIGTNGYLYNEGTSSINVTGGFALGDYGYFYNGLYNTDSATLTVGGAFSIGADGYVYNYNTSAITVTGDFTLGNDGFLYNGNSSNADATLTVGGNFSIGDASAGIYDRGFLYNESLSTFTVAGNFTIYGDGGTYVSNGTSNGDAATFTVGGSFTLGADSTFYEYGTKAFSVANGFTMGAGSYFDDLGIMSVGGNFDPGTGNSYSEDTIGGVFTAGPASTVTTDAAAWEVLGGGQVNVAGSFTVASGGTMTVGSGATVTLSTGASLTVAGDLVVDGTIDPPLCSSTTITVTPNGVLTVNPGGTVEIQSLVVQGGGQVAVDGSLTALQVTGNGITTGSGGQVNLLSANAVNIVYGTALNNSQLTGAFTANGQPVMGSFAYYPSEVGTVLGVGSYCEMVTFTPSNNQSPAVSTMVTVNVARATPIISLSAVNITYGTALSNGQLSSGTASWTVGGNPVTVAGMFAYTSNAGTVLAAGNGQSEAVTFTPYNLTDYTTASSSVTVNVAKAATATTVISSASSAVYGQQVTFTATVTNTSGTGVTPVGSVQFMVDGNNFRPPIPVNAAGQAVSAADTFLTGASHTVQAVYTPSPNFIGSSKSLTQAVQSVAVEPDPSNPLLTDLFVGSAGTTSNDQVQVNPAGSTGVKVQTSLNGVNTQTTYSQSFSTIYLFLQGGNDNVQVASSLTINTVITAGNGTDNIQLGNGNNVITLGNGNDNIQTGNGTNTIVAGIGNDNVHLGNGSYDSVTLGAGNDNVQIGIGNNETVMVGNGNDNIQIANGGNSSDDQVTIGAGNDGVQIGNGGSNSSFNAVFLPAAGNPQARIQFGTGTYNTIQKGSGGGGAPA